VTGTNCHQADGSLCAPGDMGCICDTITYVDCVETP
jgi:hypothetical protein